MWQVEHSISLSLGEGSGGGEGRKVKSCGGGVWGLIALHSVFGHCNSVRIPGMVVFHGLRCTWFDKLATAVVMLLVKKACHDYSFLPATYISRYQHSIAFISFFWHFYRFYFLFWLYYCYYYYYSFNFLRTWRRASDSKRRAFRNPKKEIHSYCWTMKNSSLHQYTEANSSPCCFISHKHHPQSDLNRNASQLRSSVKNAQLTKESELRMFVSLSVLLAGTAV